MDNIPPLQQDSAALASSVAASSADAEHSPKSLQKSLLWSGGSYAATALINFGMLYFLAQWLSPSEMALIFFSIIFQDLALLFVENGMGSYVVRADALNETELSSLFYQGLLFAVLVTGVFAACAPLIAGLMHEPAMKQSILVTAICFLPVMLAFPQRAMLQKAMHFKRIAMAEFLGMLLAGVVTVVMVMQGYGALSYLWGFFSRKLFEAILIWQKDPCLKSIPKPVILPEQVKQLFQFSAFASNALMLSYAVRLIDTMVVGRVLGTHTLGLYSLSSNLIFFPVSKCVATFNRVFIATFSEIKHQPELLRQGFLDALKKLLKILVPLLLLVAFGAPIYVPLFFKPDWLPAIPIIQVMAINGLMITFLRLSEPLLLAIGKARSVFVIYGINMLMTALLLWLLIPQGAIGAAWAVVLGSVIPCLLLFKVLKETIGLKLF